jgi:molybdate-binding protein
VAAFVASGMADVGYGVETPARQFKLDFIPSQGERYFLLGHERALETPAVQRMLETLRSAAFRRAVDALPGYRAEHCGCVRMLEEAFAALGAKPAGKPARRAAR